MRTLVCLARCRCVVRGTEVAPGPIYRPADGEEAEFVAVALRFGKLYRNAAPTREGAGHRSYDRDARRRRPPDHHRPLAIPS
jgi:hypothetical protein